MTNDQVNRIIAEWVGDEGFWPAETCPEGHPTDFGDEIGSLCALHYPDPGVDKALREEWLTHQTDPSWHPEWRIQRGEPKDYCGSLDLTAPLSTTICRERHLYWSLHMKDTRLSAQVMDAYGDVLSRDHGPTEAEALAHCIAGIISTQTRGVRVPQ